MINDAIRFCLGLAKLTDFETGTFSAAIVT
jgi:hypothetical protein